MSSFWYPDSLAKSLTYSTKAGGPQTTSLPSEPVGEKIQNQIS